MKKIVLKDGRIKEFISGEMEIMGIINVTPDSFFEGSRASSIDQAVARAQQMIDDGATFIDVGGESTRPGSDPVNVEEEKRRVCPVIQGIRELSDDVIISVDTYHAETAEAAVLAGADLINDISGLTFDENMVKVVAKYNVPVIIMHINGKPKTMQQDPFYEDVVEDVHDFLEKQVQFAVDNGVSRDKIIIDLGIGFGKTCEHNVELLKNIERFDDLGLPHLLAVSRKSFIGALLHEDDPADRLPGTLAVTLYAKSKGIEIARVHDVRENMDALRITDVLEGRYRR